MAEPFSFDDNRDEKQKEGSLEIIKTSDVVSEREARHDETCLAQVADEEEGPADNNFDFTRTPFEPWWFRSVKLTEEGRANFSEVIPKRFEEKIAEIAAALAKERVEILPTGWLASFADAWATNPGGVAGSGASLLLDSAASLHAVGDVSLLTDPVHFPNDMRGVAVCAGGAPLPIVGIGTLQSAGFSIPNVRLVDGLQKNLISVGQLDKDHGLCCCFHGQKCEVMQADGTVVGGAILRGDGLYELRFLEVAN